MNMEHLSLLHAGPQMLLSTIREKFWIVGGRCLTRPIAVVDYAGPLYR